MMRISIKLVLLCFTLWCLKSPVTLLAAELAPLRHPVLQHDIDPAKASSYEQAVVKIMAMSDEEMLSFLPDWSYARYCECPNCYGGVQGDGVFEWNVEHPNQMKCRFCGTIFPNGKYPEDHKMKGKNILGEEITFPYFFNQNRNRSHFLSNHINYLKRRWLEWYVVELGKAYQLTRKEEYARRVILVLDKLSQRYPHYPVMQNGYSAFRFQDSQRPPFSWDSGKWGAFHDEIPKSMVLAYDLVYESTEFDKLSKLRGYNVRDRLVRDCFLPAFKAVEASSYHVENVVGYDITSAALLGRVIGEPYYVHRAYQWMLKTVREGFFYDGMWKEGTASYHYMTLGGLKLAFDSVKGYSDPLGYTDQIDGEHFENLDPIRQFPILSTIAHSPSRMDWPNGISSCFHDTHPYEKRTAARNTTVSSILPGMGHASLGRGMGNNQMQVQLHFSGGYGHAHADTLNMSLFAKGSEMLPDLGYTLTQMHHWATSSLGHNLVVVDRKDQVTSGSDGDLISFFPNTGGISAVEADGKRSYSNIPGLDMYRRLLVTIPISDQDSYIVDIFRVRGGTVHDWTMNGDADQDVKATCNIKLGAQQKWMLEPGEEWREPTISGDVFNPYGMVRDVTHKATKDPLQITFHYAGDETKGIRFHIVGEDQTELWLGKSPSVRRAKMDMRKAWDFCMPKLIVRKRGQAPLRSTFVAVEEPYQGKPFVTKVERIDLSPKDPDAVALRVTHGETVDFIISTVDSPPYKERLIKDDAIKMRGKLGIVRQVSGKTKVLWLFSGSMLTVREVGIKSNVAQYEGVILDARRKIDGSLYNGFETDVELPIGNALHGAWMIIRHSSGFTHGYEIDHIEKSADKTLIVTRQDHGLRISGGKTQEVFFPQRKFEGPNRFTIGLSKAVTSL